MVIGTWHMNWFLALLGLPSLSICFSLPAQIEYFFLMDHKDFYLNVLLPFILSWTLILHCLRGQTGQYQYKSTAKLCQSYAGGAGAACPWQLARPKRQESGFHANITFCYLPLPISHIAVALSHLFVALSHLLLVYLRKFKAENLLCSSRYWSLGTQA